MDQQWVARKMTIPMEFELEHRCSAVRQSQNMGSWIALACVVVSLLVSACGGGGGSPSVAPTEQAIPYTVSTWVGTNDIAVGTNAPRIGVDGTGAEAVFGNIGGLSFDRRGNLLVADSTFGQVRRVTPAGVVTTVAGGRTSDGIGDLFFPYSAVEGSDGSIYVSDHLANSIKKISPAGVVSVFAGDGTYDYADGPGAVSRFKRPEVMVMDRAGNLFVSEAGTYAIRKITPAGVVSTFVGAHLEGGSVDGVGAQARIGLDSRMVIDGDDNLYLMHRRGLGGGALRKVTPSGVVTTVPVDDRSLKDTNGITLAVSAEVQALAIDASRNFYLVDYSSLIRRISTSGIVSEVAGQVTLGDTNGNGPSARFGNPKALAVDSSGRLYVGDGRLVRLVVPSR